MKRITALNIEDTKTPGIFLLQKKTRFLGIPWTRNLMKVKAASADEIIEEILRIASENPKLTVIDMRGHHATPNQNTSLL